MPSRVPTKIIFAVGGTGGHVYPARALARDLKNSHPELEILFVGGGLSTNPYLQNSSHTFKEIRAASPFQVGQCKALISLGKGVVESLRILKKTAPRLVIGFGSFYSFPVLAAAKLTKTPYLLVESNAFPGKVNRLFAKGALFSAVQFEQGGAVLKGKSQVVQMPIWAEKRHSKEEARKALDLDQDLFTLLIFGGSQGAKIINEAALKIELHEPYQVVHLCGGDQDPGPLKDHYKQKSIQAVVKPFEKQMDVALAAADLAICRSGAGTISELVAHTLPSLLVPWPLSADDHQFKNAACMQEAGCAHLLDQADISRLPESVLYGKNQIKTMREKLREYKNLPSKNLATLILEKMEAHP